MLGGKKLPGEIVSVRVSNRIRLNTLIPEGASGVKKQEITWDDSILDITLELLSDKTSDCYQKLESLNNTYRQSVNGRAVRYQIVNRHSQARRINNVIISSMSSSETDEDDIIQVHLKFTEVDPPNVSLDSRNSQASQTKPTLPAQNAVPDIDPDIVSEK